MECLIMLQAISPSIPFSPPSVSVRSLWASAVGSLAIPSAFSPRTALWTASRTAAVGSPSTAPSLFPVKHHAVVIIVLARVVRRPVLPLPLEIGNSTEPSSLAPTFGDRRIPPAFGQFGDLDVDVRLRLEPSTEITYALRKIHVDAMVVNQHSLHFKVRLLAVLLVLELNERILQAVSGPLVADDFTA